MNIADPLFALVKEAVLLALYTALPILCAVLLATLLTAALQTVTKMSESTLAVVPKLIAGTIAIVSLGPWLAHRVAVFAERTWSLIGTVNL